MPYVFVEELDEGQEAAEVVEVGEVETLKAQLEETREQRDQAIERADAAEKGWQEAKEKYANTFLTTPARIRENHSPRPVKATTVQDLFNPREED